jgi:hypothetical protein
LSIAVDDEIPRELSLIENKDAELVAGSQTILAGIGRSVNVGFVVRCFQLCGESVP